jgi:antitoxin YefM
MHTTYAQARAELAKLLDQVTQDRDVVIIERRGAESVALIAAAERAGLLEAAHLRRSSKNAERLLSALQRAQRRQGTPMQLKDLAREGGLGRKEVPARGGLPAGIYRGFAVLGRDGSQGRATRRCFDRSGLARPL